MTPRMFVGYMVNQSKLGGFEVSRRLGKAPTYINRYTNGGSIPSLALAAQIAKVCGYEVHLIGDCAHHRGRLGHGYDAPLRGVRVRPALAWAENEATRFQRHDG